MRGEANEEPTIGSQAECDSCGRWFRVMNLIDGAHYSGKSDIVALGDRKFDNCDNEVYGDRCWSYWSADRHAVDNQRSESHGELPPVDSPSPDEALWIEALDEAIAKVTCREYKRLKRQHPNVTARLTNAFESIGRLWTTGGLPPRYDQWDALLYVSWYQARQVNLVGTVLDQHPPLPSGKPLRIVDVGCGAWAVPIALAMLEARGHPALLDREVSVHGIEPACPMTHMGKELWLELGCAAEARGLCIDFWERMIDDDSIFTSVDAYPDASARDASAESWLLAIHAFYDAQPEIRRFLANYRERASRRLRYELLTTHASKLEHIFVGGSGEWIAPQKLRTAEASCLMPIWKGPLTETTKCRRRIHAEMKSSGNPMSPMHMKYLWNEVAWNRGDNPIEQDAIWVWTAGQ